MRVVKPQYLSVMHRVYEREHKAYLSVAVMAYMPLTETATMLHEQDLWQSVLPKLDPMTPLDAAMPKIGGEYLIVGDACAPGAVPVPGLEVSATVGGLSKRLYVFGARYWVAGGASAPAPYARQPMGWAAAYGGEGFAENPMGMGRVLVDTPAGPHKPLPHVESPAHRCTSPHAAVTPASFAPVPMTWPQRARYQGTYNDRWLKSEFPSLPSDFDSRFHNCAPADQWQAQPFVGNEAITLTHMHPAHPIIRHQLPGIRAVAIVQTKGAGPTDGQAIDMSLSTLWLFPNELRAVLIWHGEVQVGNEFADDIEHLLVAAEWVDRPRPMAAYLAALAARLDRQRGALKALDDHELLPEDIATCHEASARFVDDMQFDQQALEDLDVRLKEAQAKLDAQMVATFGAEHAAHHRAQAELRLKDRPSFKRPDRLPEDPRALLAVSRDLLAQAPDVEPHRAPLEQMKADIPGRLRRQFSAAGIDASKVDAALARPSRPGGVAGWMAQAQLGMAETARKMPAMENFQLDPKLKSMADAADPKIKSMQRSSAHLHGAPPTALDADTAARWREAALAHHAAGRSFADLKLTGADFSGLDFSGADFSRSELEGVNFASAVLRGANFSAAALAYANFEGAQLDAACFAEANLGRAAMQQASCIGGNFRKAVLHYTLLQAARFAECDFAGTSFIEVDASQAQWQRCQFDNGTFSKCALAQASFVGAAFSKICFLESDMTGANFSDTTLQRVAFVTSKLDAAVFDRCSAVKTCFTYGSSLVGASFGAARMPGTNFRNMPLDGAMFAEALLDGCDLTEAACAQASFNRASLKGALLMKGSFQGADFFGANLMNAIVQHAQLQGADFSDSNLFGADFMRVDIDSASKFDRAFSAKARLQPQRKVDPVVSA